MANHPAGMQCPVDHTVLVMSERSGIEIDYCPTCRGVWLDRGELDKIVERAATQLAPAAPPPAAPQQPNYQSNQQPNYQQGYQQDYRGGHGYPKRKKSFLDELFD